MKSIHHSITLFAALLFVASTHAQTLVVTNTQDNGTGSFRWALEQANANNNIDTISFNIPTSDNGFDPATGVFTIAVSSAKLPVVNNNGLFINGFSQTTFTGNTNTAQLGEAISVGVDQVSVPQLDGPEILIRDNGSRFDYGIKVISDDFEIRGISIHGFGSGHTAVHGDLVLDRGAENIKVAYCSFGVNPSSNTKPSQNTGGYGLSGHNADNVEISHSIFAFADNHGLFTTDKSGGCDNWTIEYCQFIDNAQRRINLDGIGLERKHNGGLVRYNYVKGSRGCGIDFYYAIGNIQVINNTIISNGRYNDESPGIRVWGANNFISKNIIASNYGAGVMVTPGATENTISQNSIYANGSIAGNGSLQPTLQIGIDLLEPDKKVKLGDDPFVSLNDIQDLDNGGNNIFNHAVVEQIFVQGNDLIIKGYATSGSTIEFFEAHNYPNAYRPQGKNYLFTLVEGSAQDLDATTAKYGPGPVNNYEQGEDSVARFEFKIAKPAAVNVGDTLTLTSTLNSNTSEFSPAFVIGIVTTKVSPVLECVYAEGNGNYSAVFGYFNPNSVPVVIAPGSDNRFSPSPQFRGQDTVFNVGRKWATFEVPFNGNNLVWILNGKTSTANANSKACYFDLEIVKTVSQTAVTQGSTVTFRIEARNKKYKPMTNVQIADTLAAGLSFVSFTASAGSYDPATGIWTVPAIANGDTASLEIVAVMNAPVMNKACFIGADQTDGNAANNCSEVLVCIDGDCNTSGGNDGGIESNGNMASKLAHQAFENKVKNGNRFYADLSQIPAFNKQALKVQRASASLSRFLPQQGPDAANGVVTTPSQLISVTNAEEMLAVDYIKNNQRLAAILAIRSNQGSVYEHTKVICDRLNGATLNNIQIKDIAGNKFIMAKMTQANGAEDYAITFVANKRSSGEIFIDSKWNIEEYGIGASDSVFNFQVWSVSPDQTIKMVEEILANLAQNGNLVYKNKFNPSLPYLFVTHGEYKNGQLKLFLQNNAGASEASLFGNVALVENGERFDFQADLEIQSNGNETYVVYESNYIFDAGFSIANEQYAGVDVLYFADGPWGVDYEKSGATLDNFQTTPHIDAYLQADDYAVERAAKMQGNVKDYVSLYKNFRVGALPVDLSAYNQLEFVANSTGELHNLEIVISSTEITNWQEQYRVNYQLTPNTKQAYAVSLADLTSSSGAALDLSNATALTFVVNGNGNTWSSYEIELSEVKFTDNYSAITGIEKENGAAFKVYPNPSNGLVNITLNEVTEGDLTVNLIDQTGRLVNNLYNGFANNAATFSFNVQGIASGIYFIELEIGGIKTLQKLSIRN